MPGGSVKVWKIAASLLAGGVVLAILGRGSDDAALEEGKMPSCSIHAIDDGGWEYDEYPGAADYWEIVNAAEELFTEAGINLSSYEEPLYACITEEGDVVGSMFAGSPGENDEMLLVRFSAVVSPKMRRRGVGSRLVAALVEHYRQVSLSYGRPVRLEAWVVNPNMARLLDEMGFEHTGSGEWSQDDPYFELWV